MKAHHLQSQSTHAARSGIGMNGYWKSNERRGLPTKPHRVAIFRALKLGDLLCSVPALRAFRANWPTAELTLIGLPWAVEFVARFSHYVDRYIEFPGYPGLPERIPRLKRIPQFLRAMQRERFDLAIQLHGTGDIVNELVVLFNARQTAGFFRPGGFCPDPATFTAWPDTGLEIHRLLSLVRALGLVTYGDELEFPLIKSDFDRLAQVAGMHLPRGEYVVIHPGASSAERRWAPENFAHVADCLHSAGLAVVVTGVPSEHLVGRSVAARMQSPSLNLCGRTDLGCLAALVAHAALVVCNDTGISHVAAAVRTPSVVISTAENRSRWAPIDQTRHQVLCRPAGVPVKEVIFAARKLLAELRCERETIIRSPRLICVSK
jgi:ADP-heptose:LPS heptosyltransferase